MLDNFFSAFQLLRMKPVPPFHVIQHPLFCKSGNPAAARLFPGALRSFQTTAASGRGVVSDVAARLMALKAERQTLAGGADIAIAARDVMKSILGKEAFLQIG
jgi:hypothetical protein